ncbi:PKD domain-containing protein, partial [Cellulomonas edaphi]
MPQTGGFRVPAAVTTAVVAALTCTTVLVAPSGAFAATSEGADIVYRDEWPQIAADTFARSMSDGWGTAQAGGAWSHAGSTANYGVAGSAGTITLPKTGSTLSSYLRDVSTTDVDLTTTISWDKLPTVSGSYLTVVGRRVGTLDYGAKLRLNANGSATVAVLDGTASIGTVTIPGTFGADDKLNVRTQVTGTSPTTVRVKAWKAGTAEPADWSVQSASSTAGLQTAGFVGVSAYLSGSVSNVPVTYAFDDFAVTSTRPVQVGNYVPTSSITTAVKDLGATFDGSGSSDRDGSVVAWDWKFGDGATAKGAKTSHTYAAAGTYTATLTVTDDLGATRSSSADVTVKEPNKPPTAVAVGTSADLTATLDGSKSTDPDGSIASWSWTFGDGSTGTGVRPTHVYTKAGTYPVVLTVKDNDGATGTATTNVTVKEPNKAPTARVTSSTDNLSVTVDGSTSVDPDGTIASYAWTFGDGSTATGATAKHTYASAGTYPITLTVTDDEGAKHTTSAQATVRVPNVAPVAAMTSKVTDLAVAFDATGSRDSDGTIASYAWTFGD